MTDIIELFEEFCDKANYSVVRLLGEKQDNGSVRIFLEIQKNDGLGVFKVKRTFSKATLDDRHLLMLELIDMEAELQHYLEEMEYES